MRNSLRRVNAQAHKAGQFVSDLAMDDFELQEVENYRRCLAIGGPYADQAREADASEPGTLIRWLTCRLSAR
jgi:hypothetical protein